MKAHYGKKFILIYMAVNTTIIISAINSLSFIRASSLGSLCTSPTYALSSQTEINYRAIYAIRNSRIIFCMIEEYLKKYTIYVICINVKLDIGRVVNLFASQFLPSPQAVLDGAVCLRKFHWLYHNILIINIDKFL